MSLLNELKRRNVLRVGAAYIVAAWLLIQVVDTIFPMFGLGTSESRLFVIVLAIGFVPVLIFSWVFEWTPQGFKRDGEVDHDQSIKPQTGKKLDRIFMLVLALALGYFAFDKFVLDPDRDVAITESATKAGVEQAREEARLGMFNDKSVAVLPFTNRSEQKEDEYFTDGMHDELLTRLSRFASLKVISRTSVMRYRDTVKSIPEIARELSVATILEGGVQRSGDHVRINVQLINAHTDEHLWAEIYDRELTAKNLFAIQSEISTAIADALQATLSPAEESQIYALPTSNMTAYNHFLRGRQLMAKRRADELKQAYKEFTRATEIDPDFALAWVGVTDTVLLLSRMGAFEQSEQLEVRRQAAEKALALNDQLGEAYASLATIYGDQGEDEKEEAAFIKSIELNPNYAQAYHWYSISQSGWDQEDKSLQLIYKAAQLDPVSSVVQLNLATSLMGSGRYEEGRLVAQKLLQMDPGFAVGYSSLGHFEADRGQLAQAVHSIRKALELDPGNRSSLGSLARALIVLGDFEAFADVRVDMVKSLNPNNGEIWWMMYKSLVAQSKWQEAIDLLENLPEQVPDWVAHPSRYIWLYLYAGDFEKSYKALLKWRPQIVDRESWKQDFTIDGEFNCYYAGILREVGEEALGRDLLQLIINNFEEIPSVERMKRIDAKAMAQCYLLAGEYDQAFDLLEGEISTGRLIDTWYEWGKWPWWKQLEDNPRYQAMVADVESKLAVQRVLLKEMDESAEHPG